MTGDGRQTSTRYDTPEIVELRKRIAALEQDMRSVRESERKREVEQLKWGIRALGVVIMAMGGWIWSQIGGIFDVGASGR